MMGLRAAGFLALAASAAAASLNTAKNKNFGHSIKQAPLDPSPRRAGSGSRLGSSG